MEHRDYGKRAQRVRTHSWKHFVPVPIGPALPRRDRHKNTADWPEAFSKFMESCPPQTQCVLNNMQVRNNNAESDMDEIMDHIDSVENYYSRANAESHANIDDCLWELQEAGMFSCEANDPNCVEDQWKSVYEDRRNEWKQKLGNVQDVSMSPVQSTQSVAIMTAADAVPGSAEHHIMQLTTVPSNKQERSKLLLCMQLTERQRHYACT